MSFTRKVIDGAKSGLNSLMAKVAADDTPLSHVDEGELQRELELRVAAKKRAGLAPDDNPVAKMAGATDAARQARGEAAERRQARIHGEQKRRADAEAAERERAFREAKQRAQREAPRSSAGASGSARQRFSDRARSMFDREDPKLAAHYKTLDLPYGAGFDEVKKAYRRLMRKYHPDLHGGSAKKQKAATELTMRVTQAYNALDQHLNGGRSKGQ